MSLQCNGHIKEVFLIPAAGFAVVKLATEKATGGEYAVKIMALPEKGRVVGENENTRDDIFKEIDILVGLNHPNVIYLKEYFEESNKVGTLRVAQRCPDGRCVPFDVALMRLWDSIMP